MDKDSLIAGRCCENGRFDTAHVCRKQPNVKLKKVIRIIHRNGINFVDSMCELDEESSLVRFYLDGVLQFAVSREDFLFSEMVERPC